jgi:ArsR family transcriptional regulator
VVCAEWDRIRRHYIEDTLSFLMVSSLIQPDAVAVDVGTGTGEVLLSLAKMAGRVIGVDRSEKMLAVCRQRVAEAKLDNVELIRAEAEQLPLDDACCDVAFSSMLLHHLSDPAAGVREMARIARPGGKVVITDLVHHDCDWTREVMADVWLGFEEEQIRAWLAAAGLESVAYWPTRMPASADPENVGKLQAFIATGVKPGGGE